MVTCTLSNLQMHQEESLLRTQVLANDAQLPDVPSQLLLQTFPHGASSPDTSSVTEAPRRAPQVGGASHLTSRLDTIKQTMQTQRLVAAAEEAAGALAVQQVQVHCSGCGMHMSDRLPSSMAAATRVTFHLACTSRTVVILQSCSVAICVMGSLDMDPRPDSDGADSAEARTGVASPAAQLLGHGRPCAGAAAGEDQGDQPQGAAALPRPPAGELLVADPLPRLLALHNPVQKQCNLPERHSSTCSTACNCCILRSSLRL